MKDVTRDEFWRIIMATKVDVHPTPTGNWPYLNVWKKRTGEIVGLSREQEPRIHQINADTLEVTR